MKTETITQEEYQKMLFETTLAKSILANQFALNCNEVLKYTPYYRKEIKTYGRPFINQLIKYERKEFEKVDEFDTKRVDEIFQSIDELMNTISRAVLSDWSHLDMIIKEYAKRPNEVMTKLFKENSNDSKRD